MAEFTFAKSASSGKKRLSITSSNIAYALFVLFCFWAGAQMLSMLIHAPGVFEHLIQMQDSSHPRVEIGLMVGTLFGLIPFLAGCVLIGILGLIFRWRRHH
ncbi:Inner membrane protein YaiY [Klebsiella spallanzanii]|uniref:Inner membrane protein YaiY n=1 Tax=Klebsiella spallanzanii TaxID=2587528 RepID=A0A564M6W6_9ENTR|nr:DUF2755 family protein [Klebsiella spallanzanii]VUS85478.1 Inner membrane protein YaiY [Klebsiella spallanzanii]VUS89221.1 Inner membrane protein YaiY [Klebsiella spallanzanii]VUT11514.1 Inner membrane protein YaiY [Klebsiella spallanzanii]